jgi:hypothetical protein
MKRLVSLVTLKRFLFGKLEAFIPKICKFRATSFIKVSSFSVLCTCSSISFRKVSISSIPLANSWAEAASSSVEATICSLVADRDWVACSSIPWFFRLIARARHPITWSASSFMGTATDLKGTTYTSFDRTDLWISPEILPF